MRWDFWRTHCKFCDSTNVKVERYGDSNPFRPIKVVTCRECGEKYDNIKRSD